MARTTERKTFLNDTLCIGFEGGIGYWSTSLTYRWSSDGGDTADLDGFHGIIVDTDEWFDGIKAAGDRLGRRPKRSEVVEELGDKVHRIDADALARGIGLIVKGGTPDKATGEKHPFIVNERMTRTIRNASAENDAGQLDASDADAIIQAACFGEVIYG